MKNLLLCIGVVCLFTGCYKDTDTTPPPQIIIETTEVFVNTSISGSVVDEDGQLLSNYILKINDEINVIQSDQFYLQLDDVKKKGQTIHVYKDDHRIGIRTQLLVENDINHLEIFQHPRPERKSIDESSSLIEFTKSISIDFSSTRYAKGYNGAITAEYTHIDSEISLTPVGYSSESDLLAVESHGGFYLTLKDGDGNRLEAHKENPIILQFDELDENVNSLFVFDEEDEYWILVDDISSGDEVEILGEGYYTFAKYTPGVFVEGLVTKEEKPVAYQPMDWTLANMSNEMCATEKGKWIALLPEKEDVEVNLLNPCNEFLQSETLEIESNDISGHNLVISNQSNYQAMNMTVLDCDGMPVSTPIFNVDNGTVAMHYVFSDQYEDRWIAVCDEFSIEAIDGDTGQAGPTVEWSTAISDQLDIMTHCSEYENGYSYIKIRNDEKVYKAFEIEEEGDRTILRSSEGNVKFKFKGMEEGMYAVNEVNVFIDDKDFDQNGYYIKCENSADGCGIDQFNVTHYDQGVNGMVRVTFSGTLWMQTFSPLLADDFDIEGVIVIKR